MNRSHDTVNDFTPNGVDLKSFPYNAWRKLSKDILTDDKTELFRSGESKGELGSGRQSVIICIRPEA